MKVLHTSLCGVMFFGIVFFAVGCFSNTLDIPTEGARIEQVCSTPKYNIALIKIENGKENTLPKQEFQAILDKALVDSNCFNFVKNDDKAYTLHIRYNFTITEVSEDTSAISSKEQVTLKSNVQFNLYNKAKTIQQNAISTLKLSEKTYLGLGENVQVTQGQKEEVIRRSLKTIFANLSTMP